MMFRRSLLYYSCLSSLVLLSGLSARAASTETASTGTDATNALRQLAQSFSRGKPVSKVQLTGNATWHAGSLEDSGPVTLTASSSGTTQVQLSLSSLGVRTESQSGQGSGQSCTWSGGDGISHDVDANNCWKPVVWFLPAISLQPALLLSSVGISDLGMGAVGSGTHHHLQSQLVFADLTKQPKMLKLAMQASTTDIGIDASSHLPAVITYQIQPDSGSQTPIDIEIRYANYTAVNGVQVPFSIQRYVNGTLQLDIAVSAAVIN